MRVNLSGGRVLLVLACLFAFAAAPGGPAFSQQSDVLGVGSPVSIVRKVKVDRVSHKPRPVEKALLLKLEWRLQKVSANGSDEETGKRTFNNGDRVRLSVRTNQDGYLYVIHQKSPSSPGVVIFPDSAINYGNSQVGKSEELVLPSNCPVNISRRDCSVILTFGDSEELFHLFFTREPFTDLPNSASDATNSIPATLLEKLKNESGQILRRQKGSTPFSELLTNINTKDNEDIMETITLTKH